MLGRITARQRGDTLIEVLFAITVFSLIVVTTLSLMNQGTAAARRSVESTLVREQLDAQAETLRFMHQSYVMQYRPGAPTVSTGPAAEYKKVIDHVITANRKDATPLSSDKVCPAIPTDAFVVNPRTAVLSVDAAKIVSPEAGYAQLSFDPTNNADMTSRGIWIEAIRTNVEAPLSSLTATAGYIDYYIRGCWYAPGSGRALSMGTIVRLYEPRG